MLTSVNKLLLLHETIHTKLHTPLLTISNFTQQIITSMKFSFQFPYSFGPTHARKIIMMTIRKLTSLGQSSSTGSQSKMLAATAVWRRQISIDSR